MFASDDADRDQSVASRGLEKTVGSRIEQSEGGGGGTLRNGGARLWGYV